MTITESIVAALNDFLATDKIAATRLVEFRTPCNLKVAEHPSIVVRVVEESSEQFDVGLIGLLQALAVVDGKRVTTQYDCSTGELTGFGAVDIAVVNPPAGDVV